MIGQQSCSTIINNNNNNQLSSKQANSSNASGPVSELGGLGRQPEQASNGSAGANSIDAADEYGQTSAQLELENYWLQQRDAFFNQTTFNLTRSLNELVGVEYGQRSYHLPYWFDYEMFKNLTERTFNDTELALKRHHIYVDNCVAIWKSCALKRLHRPNNYTFIDHAEDWVS